MRRTCLKQELFQRIGVPNIYQCFSTTIDIVNRILLSQTDP